MYMKIRHIQRTVPERRVYNRQAESERCYLILCDGVSVLATVENAKITQSRLEISPNARAVSDVRPGGKRI